MENKENIKKIKNELIILTKYNNFLDKRNKETWKSYLERIIKVKKPSCMLESLLYVMIITEKFNLNEVEKQEALKILGFTKRS